MLKTSKKEGINSRGFWKQIEIYGDYIPNRTNINLSPNENIWCDVCGKILRRGGMYEKYIECHWYVKH